MEAIQYIGIDQLDDTEKQVLDKLSAEYYEKIQRMLKNETSIVIHVKEYEKQGSRKKYSLHVRAIAPTVIFESSNASDWDLARTLHKAFNDIEKQIEHRFKPNKNY